MLNDVDNILDAIDYIKKGKSILLQKVDNDDALDCIDGYVDDLISDLEYIADNIEEEYYLENPTRSDFDEHNVWNKAQTGVK